MLADFAPSRLLDDLRHAMPVAGEAVDLTDPTGTGLVNVDVVNGFATVGAGNLAPPEANPQVDRMVAETDRLARAFDGAGAPVFAFQDCHQPGTPEPPFPPHCERGSGEEDLVPALKWLETAETVTRLYKDCIDGFIGAHSAGGNALADWIARNGLTRVVVTGICTDICVLDLVLSLLSARNHGTLPPLETVTVVEPATATYDLPRETAEHLGLPQAAAHPQAVSHWMGLAIMARRGARIAESVTPPTA